MIGTSTNVFSGMFDGGAHTLKNIKIFGKNAIGLIGTSKNSLIQGLNVENIYVTGNTRLGAVTGQSFSGIISEINVTGTIEIYKFPKLLFRFSFDQFDQTVFFNHPQQP